MNKLFLLILALVFAHICLPEGLREFLTEKLKLVEHADPSTQYQALREAMQEYYERTLTPCKDVQFVEFMQDVYKKQGIESDQPLMIAHEAMNGEAAGYSPFSSMIHLSPNFFEMLPSQQAFSLRHEARHLQVSKYKMGDFCFPAKVHQRAQDPVLKEQLIALEKDQNPQRLNDVKNAKLYGDDYGLHPDFKVIEEHDADYFAADQTKCIDCLRIAFIARLMNGANMSSPEGRKTACAHEKKIAALGYFATKDFEWFLEKAEQENLYCKAHFRSSLFSSQDFKKLKELFVTITINPAHHSEFVLGLLVDEYNELLSRMIAYDQALPSLQKRAEFAMRPE